MEIQQSALPPVTRRTALKVGAAGLTGVVGGPLLAAGSAHAAPPVPPAGPTASAVLHLSGTDKDDTVDWEFTVTHGRRANEPSTIPVPSCWETQGFGTYTWGWNLVPEERGLYRHTFTPPAEWAGRSVALVFEGSMTDTAVTVNGTSAGPVHRGGFYRFSYDVSALLTYGAPTVLEVVVSRDSANASINDAERTADYWIFGGIFRPVYLLARPVEHIDRLAIDAEADGALSVDAVLAGVSTADRVEAQVVELDGTPVGAPFGAPVTGAGPTRLTTAIAGPRQWTAETPNLYRVRVRLLAGDAELHATEERFGFRTVEVRPRDGVYVNGTKVRFKGINRHAFWPTSGRTLSAEIDRGDIALMKEMNLNAVRMSHYPQDQSFYDLCDELGLYVIDELAGWQGAYDTASGRPLIAEMVQKNVNHPSILFWANGNEGGWNRELDGDYALHDPQRRTVLHPWDLFGGIETDHYENYANTVRLLDLGDIHLPTEFLHGLYDGGAGAGIDDYWNLMLSRPNAAGGFLWALIDEGLVRTDRNGVIDTTGNSAPDGVVGPYREKEASFATLKEVWSPIQAEPVDLAQEPRVAVRITNRYDFTDARDCAFRYELVRFPDPGAGTGPEVVHSGEVERVGIAPQSTGEVVVTLPPGQRERSDALRFTALDPTGAELFTWTWPLVTAQAVSDRVVVAGPGTASATEDAAGITMAAGGVSVTIGTDTGRLTAVSRNGVPVSFTDGPVLVAGTGTLSAITHAQEGADHVVTATYTGDLQQVVWRMLGSGWLRLDYRYALTGSHDFLGVTFSYPENRCQGMTWLGRGPDAVYKNRLRGPVLDVWSKDYNDAAAGAAPWVHPVFKGYHAGTRWAQLRTTEGPITVVMAGEDVFLRLFTPRTGSSPQQAVAPFPAGGISLLDGISAIGTKFSSAPESGPAGEPNVANGVYERTVHLRFGA